MCPINYPYLLTAHNDRHAQEHGVRPRFFVRNYGCQMNARDAEKLAALLLQLGFDRAGQWEDADLVLFNTCCVRESAENKVLGHISRLKPVQAARAAGGARLLIVVCGCMTQQAHMAELFGSKFSYVDVVCGTHNRHRLAEFLWQTLQSGKQVIDINEDEHSQELDEAPPTTREFAHKAGVNIMYGCDNFCSFCIVPYVRGRPRSRPVAAILEETRALAADGVREVMLLGQNVNAYRDTDVSFAALLHRVAAVPGLQRIRFMTSHPKDFDHELVAALRDLPTVCKQVHLPLQSGSSRILSDMNRRYTQAQYLALAAQLQQEIPGVAITTDIIVGYPGETEEDFQATLDVVQQVNFAGAFTFIYSPRSGTPAATRTDTVPRPTATERFERLTDALYPRMLARNQQKLGHTLSVMLDTPTQGRTDDGTLVHVTPAGHARPGDILPVLVDTAKTFYVSGTA